MEDLIYLNKIDILGVPEKNVPFNEFRKEKNYDTYTVNTL